MDHGERQHEVCGSVVLAVVYPGDEEQGRVVHHCAVPSTLPAGYSSLPLPDARCYPTPDATRHPQEDRQHRRRTGNTAEGPATPQRDRQNSGKDRQNSGKDRQNRRVTGQNRRVTEQNRRVIAGYGGL